MEPAKQTEISGTWSIKLFFRCLVTRIKSRLAHKAGQRLPCSRGWALKMAYEFLGRGAHGLVERRPSHRGNSSTASALVPGLTSFDDGLGCVSVSK